MKVVVSTLLIFLSITTMAQKTVLDHSDFDLWKTIKNQSISTDGNFVMYSLEKGEADNYLKIRDANAKLVYEHERAKNGQFLYDANYAVFTIKAWQDSVREMKRRKVKKEELPKDTLGIYNLKHNTLDKIANVKSYKIPKKWAGFIAYQLEAIKEDKENPKTEVEEPSEKEKIMKAPPKKVGKENGYHLIVRNLITTEQDTFKYVIDYLFAKEGKFLAFSTTGQDSTHEAGVFMLNLENNNLTNVIASKKAKYYQLALSETGKNLGFIADLDTTKALIRPNSLYHWQAGNVEAIKLIDATTTPANYMVSANGKISFSKDETKMFFGLATQPILQDTTLLKEEIVNVEVWTYNEPRLYTVQELQVEQDKKKSYSAAIHLNNNNKLVQLGTLAYPNATLGNEGNADFALLSTSVPYQLQAQWQGATTSDFALINTNTGKISKILSNVRGTVELSPAGKYVYGYNSIDSTWFTYSISSARYTELTKGKVFYDELNDNPDYPYQYGSAGWTEDDASLLLYDRYDIWEFTPENSTGKLLTDGRKNSTTFRYVQLDDDERFIPKKGKLLLKTFNEESKNSGYYEWNRNNSKGKQLISGAHKYSTLIKAQKTDKLIFTRQSFKEFPDIRYADLTFKTQTKLSTANPQQDAYNWGTAEIIKWTSLDGVELEGMLIKPENFDPEKKYPMIVNFYEKSSDGLHNHRTPAAGRSTINYSFYASRGYLIFNPNVNYRIGYPGESAYNCVIPGVTSLIEKGFVDKDNIGVQGHSWGGYQIAYLVTKTDIFKAAEAGAPVPNMISAYGGIRWWTGLSRQFQYEHTQSRIGGTPWEYPSRFIENSPIFFIDKINTPLLVMHNDADGHVPWYQGIEFFVSLRRLGKPAWFLNYNGEPHWPLKRQNRKDFNIRMGQFFDYYLKSAPMPIWMDRGVPALEKGINQGLELIDR